MRRRSETIQADTYEEYLEISISQAPNMRENNLVYVESIYNEPPAFFEEKGQFNMKRPGNIEMEDSYFTMVGFDDNNFNLDMQIEQFDESKSVSTGLSSRNLSGGASASFDFDVLSPCFSPTSNNKIKFEKSRVFKAMLVGSTGTGRHSLINSAFRENAVTEKKIRNSFDLVIKSQEQEGCLNTFKFWLRDPTDKKMESLIKIYFKSINLYIFVYKIEDYRSFELLDKAIEQIKAEVPEGKFQGLLIGTTSNGNLFERKVSSEEGSKLQTKHKLSQFVELKHSSSNIEKTLLDFIIAAEK